ncbi:MAG: small multi-drug export protein [Candidatus Atabeyarchaeum deiterrae]
MAVDLISIIVVLVLATSAEILIAIPIGVLIFGMDPALAFLVAYPANLIPIIIILPLVGYLDKRFPRFFDYLARRSGRFQKRLEGKYGLAFLFLIIPITGVYGASIASGLLRFDKERSFLVQSLALAFYGAIEVVLLYLGIRFIIGL